MVSSWVDHVIWWQVYPLGFISPKELLGLRGEVDRLPRLQGWLDHLISWGGNGLLLGPIFTSSSHGYDTVENGGRPANFMDIRTTASSLDVAYGFDLILANPKVRAVLVNVHGGGMQRCDTIAEGVGIALRRNGRHVPIVVRLAGNNADFARVRLSSYGISFDEGADMADAVRRTMEKVSQMAA